MNKSLEFENARWWMPSRQYCNPRSGYARGLSMIDQLGDAEIYVEQAGRNNEMTNLDTLMQLTCKCR